MSYENFPNYIDETPGKKVYCTCGESAKKPYCDGSHSRLNTGKSPKEHVIEISERVRICDCGQTKSSPFCDGNHNCT